MRLNTMLPIPAWLTEQETKHYKKLRHPFMKNLRERGIPLDPFLAMRIHDLIIAMLYIHRAEAVLYVYSSCGGELKSCGGVLYHP